tara:strand:+ start:587 stop:1069 length:483 start_codon:yes stop_codon:yes gene_type:complete
MFNLKSSLYLKLIFTVSLISIITAYFIEYALGYQPCNLCLIERVPYVLSIILISIIFIFKKSGKFLILLLTLIFTFSFLISIYHLGIELGFIEESLVCGLKNTAETISKEELLKQLNEINISCKDVTFRIFGLSLTSINMILSFVITIITIKIYILNEKN